VLSHNRPSCLPVDFNSLEFRPKLLSSEISTKYLSLFILSVAYLHLNAASYDGEIWHADAYRPRAGRAGFYVLQGRRYKNNDIFPKMRASRPTLLQR